MNLSKYGQAKEPEIFDYDWILELKSNWWIDGPVFPTNVG